MAYLSNLCVAPSGQRRGIGRELLLRAEAVARCARAGGWQTCSCPLGFEHLVM